MIYEQFMNQNQSFPASADSSLIMTALLFYPFMFTRCMERLHCWDTSTTLTKLSDTWYQLQQQNRTGTNTHARISHAEWFSNLFLWAVSLINRTRFFKITTWLQLQPLPRSYQKESTKSCETGIFRKHIISSSSWRMELMTWDLSNTGFCQQVPSKCALGKKQVLKSVQIVFQYISHCLPTLLKNICSQMKKLQHFWELKTSDQKRTLYTSAWSSPPKRHPPNQTYRYSRAHTCLHEHQPWDTKYANVSDHPVLSTEPTYAA